MQKLQKSYSTRKTPQTQPIPGSKQVANNAGGFSFEVNDWMKLDRFLILGTEKGSYYTTEQKLTKDNCEAVTRCIKADGLRVVKRVVEISDAGRAPKNDPALFVLAMCSSLGSDEVRKEAFVVLPKVARIGTHLFHFAAYREAFGGWGRAMRRAVGDWYNNQDAKDLAYGVIKYQQRDGWSNRDLLRLSHPMPVSDDHKAIFNWIITKGAPEVNETDVKDSRERAKRLDKYPLLIEAYEEAQTASTKRLIALIEKHNLPREVIPTDKLKDADVWEALLQKMPMTATIRNLATMTKIGLLKPMSAATKLVKDRITDEAALKKARVHPIQILSAMLTYQAGHGMRSDATWDPVTSIIDALDDSFYKAFDNVQPTGKRVMLALDVSGSMSSGDVGGVMGLTPRMASSAMAMVTARVEKDYMIMAFSDRFIPLNISPKQRLDDICAKTDGLPFESTDCAQPMIYAMEKKLDIDAFAVWTDSETYNNPSMHPVQALREYRRQTGIAAKLVVVGMVSNSFSIADPNDAGMLDCVGFDTSAPAVIEDFIRG